MQLLEWSDALELSVPSMDETHREFLAVLNGLADASDEGIPAAFEALRQHTVAHFDQERGWMVAMDFPAAHCHLAEHEGVLEVMREVEGYLAAGKLEVARVLARELAEWFRGHAATMDAMLAQYMRAKCMLPETAGAPA
jgi:hemerythrin-like metal-binding protein